MNFEPFYDELKKFVQSENEPLKAEIKALQKEVERLKGATPTLYTVAETCDILGNGMQPLSRTAFEVYRERDLLRTQQSGKKSKIWVISKDVENLKKVLETSETHRLPPHFIRDWE